MTNLITSRKPATNPNLRSSARAALAAAVLAGLFGNSGCQMEIFHDECRSDSDCGPGYGCDGFLTYECVQRCESHDDCAGDEYCSDDYIQRFTQCKPGCRADEQCGPGRICEEGTCSAGCRVDSECPTGQACIQSSCAPGCRADSECAPDQQCLCNACAASGCRSDADCGAEAFCPTGHLDAICSPVQCQPLPAPLTCGAASCPAEVVHIAFGESVLSPCCLPGTEGGCGVNVGGFEASPVTCQVLGEPGTSDAACPSHEGRFGVLPGCRRADGRCGFDADAVVGPLAEGFGCLLAE